MSTAAPPPIYNEQLKGSWFPLSDGVSIPGTVELERSRLERLGEPDITYEIKAEATGEVRPPKNGEHFLERVGAGGSSTIKAFCCRSDGRIGYVFIAQLIIIRVETVVKSNKVYTAKPEP